MTRKLPQEADTDARTDAQVFAAARRVLDSHLAVPGTVRVHVERGTATLTGSVRLAAERTEAEAAVRAVAGVNRVVNEINVANPVSPEGFEPPAED